MGKERERQKEGEREKISKMIESVNRLRLASNFMKIIQI